jgi:hypothetical protein
MFLLLLIHRIEWSKFDCFKDWYLYDARFLHEYHMFGVMGRNSYARALIEINASNEFKDNLVLVVPNLEGSGYTKENICIEYEWEPPRCSTCLLYGHDDCPEAALKRVVNGTGKSNDINLGVSKSLSSDGFTVVKRKGGNIKKFNAIQINKFEYRPVALKNTKISPSKDNKKESTSKDNTRRLLSLDNQQLLLKWFIPLMFSVF